ncbi:MAG TPA: exodeoxyribonuclease VII large subunit [Anaerolineales bacterium]|nr:exodeoxyribonuclease VII large subunit [Anaerolineales bacterium]
MPTLRLPILGLTISSIRFILIHMDSQLSLFPENQPASYSVFELNAYLRQLMEGDPNLQDVWVRGEISNLSVPKSGHMYFTLKDPQASLRCVMWRSQVARLTYRPEEGAAVEVHGSISVYEAGGQYQLYADDIQPAGEGLLYQEFLQLKDKLEKEGLFDAERKRALPYAPKTIGIVTSPTSAAIRDMLNTLQRRYPLVEVVLAPAAVQGDAAPGEIVRGIQNLNETVQPDVIIVGRGGGSIEDLWAFNNERVARAIAASAAPVISGVGHETDFTIADFVADLRAPTPTAAAELAVPDQMELRGILLERFETLTRLAADTLEESRWTVQQAHNRLERLSPEAQLASGRQQADDLLRRGERALAHRIQLQRTQLEGQVQQLAALSPKNVLGRGYAVVTTGGKLVKKTQDVKPGDDLTIQVSDGEIDAQVKEG